MTLSRIDFNKLADKLSEYSRMWVAISEDNEIISSGRTFAETVNKVPDPEKVILFKVPATEYTLAP
jgi:hypothetical protein